MYTYYWTNFDFNSYGFSMTKTKRTINPEASRSVLVKHD